MPAPPPEPRTRFIGRRGELARVRDLLAEHRMVTVTGVGGVGKTRLALRLARTPPPGAGAICWADLAPLGASRLVIEAVRAGAGLPPPSSPDPIEGLARQLDEARTLLVLDNCEHLREACATLARELLDHTSRLRILATSREALGVPGEVAWPLPPLSLPKDDPGEDAAGETSGSEAVTLLVDRVRLARPDLDLTPDHFSVLVELSRRLDGIPLALELAAGRTHALTLEQVAERLAGGLSLLTTRQPDVPPRHRTMHDALAWSHALLSAEERALFRRLGVFGGGASLEACEAVCAGGPVDEADVLSLIERLVVSSLVSAEERDGSARYRLLEPVRHFALERLDEVGDRQATLGRHAAYYLALAVASSARLRGPSRPAALREMEAEHANLRRAWDHALETEDTGTLADLTRALFWFWQLGGHVREGRTLCEEAFQRFDGSAHLRVELLYGSGALAWMQGDYDVARTRLVRCVAECRAGASPSLLATALRELAGVHLVLEDSAGALELYEEAEARLRESEEGWDLALTLVMLADVRQSRGDAAPAQRLREEARALFSQMDDAWGLSLTYFGLSVGAARQGDLATARLHAREALSRQRLAGDEWNIGQVLVLLAEIETRSDDAERAAELARESLSVFRRVGDRHSLAHALQILASAEYARGRSLRAVRLAGAGHALAEIAGGAYPYALATPEERAGFVAGLRRDVGEHAFAEEWAAGSAMSVDESLGYALEAGDERVAAQEGAGEPAGAELRVLGLGPTTIYRGGRRLRTSDWTYALPRELLFYLLLNGPRTKEGIGLDLWPEASREQLRGRFRTALYHLRRGVGGREWVTYEDGRYDFARGMSYWFDVEAFESALDGVARIGEADPHEGAARLREALLLYRGELLEGESPGRWVEPHRDRLRRRYLEGGLKLAAWHEAAGAHAAAAEAFRRVLDVDEMHEEAARGLARSLARMGDRPGALRHLDRLVDLFREELDAEPGPEILALRARLECAKGGE